MDIKGMTFKGIKTFRGHEGEICYQGNIYLHNKKVGYFSDNMFMGPMNIRIDYTEAEKELKEIAKILFEKVPYGLDNSLKTSKTTMAQLYKNDMLEGLLTQALEIWQLEQEFNDTIKQGYKVLVMYKEFPDVENGPKAITKYYMLSVPAQVDNLRNKGYVVLRVFKSPEDFILK